LPPDAQPHADDLAVALDDEWLSPAVQEVEQLAAMLQPNSASEMEADPASDYVNNCAA
jgi:hypothetical protein